MIKTKLVPVAVWGVVALCALLSLNGCLENGTGSSGRRLSSKFSLEDALNASLGPVLLQTAVRTPSSPNGSLDLVGKGDGAIGQYCQASGQGSTTANNCRCVFDFVDANQTPSRIEVLPYYQEDNLLRCDFSQVPTTISYVTIRLAVSTTSNGLAAVKVSNDLIFYLNGFGSGSDLSALSDFTKISRYQCHDAIVVPYAFDAAIYDPITSEDPQHTYPLNFYTSNFGRSLAAFVSNDQAIATGGAGWVCPTNPNLIPGSVAGSPPPRNDMRLFSEEPLAGDSVIFHPAPAAATRSPLAFDRSSFYLSRKPSGMFTVPVHAYTAPNTNTVDNPDDTQAGPIGYGAQPIPEGVGTGRENCPSVNYPGYRWVKVWQFRASLDPRQVPVMRSSEQNMLGRMVCPVTAASPPQPYVSLSTNKLAVTLQGALSSSASPGLLLGAWGAAPSTAILLRQLSSPSVPTTSVFEGDDKFTLASPDSNTSRFDFLFVASPAQQLSANEVVVHTTDFRDGPTTAALMYTPYRFLSANDCPFNETTSGPLVLDPRVTSNSTCVNTMQTQHYITYGFRSTNVNVPGDPNPYTGGGRLPDFPVCALQKL